MGLRLRQRLVYAVIVTLVAWNAWNAVTAYKGGAVRSAVGMVPFSGSLERAIELRVEQSNSLSQVTILVLGGVFTLLLGRTAGTSSAMALVISGFLLCVSFLSGNKYVDGLVGALVVGAVTSSSGELTIPDVFAIRFDSWRLLQQNLMLSGIVVAALSALFLSQAPGSRSQGE